MLYAYANERGAEAPVELRALFRDYRAAVIVTPDGERYQYAGSFGNCCNANERGRRQRLAEFRRGVTAWLYSSAP